MSGHVEGGPEPSMRRERERERERETLLAVLGSQRHVNENESIHSSFIQIAIQTVKNDGAGPAAGAKTSGNNSRNCVSSPMIISLSPSLFSLSLEVHTFLESVGGNTSSTWGFVCCSVASISQI